jgi:ribonuclease D
VQQLLPFEDASKFVTEDQKERFQMADWRVRIPSQQHNDLRLPHDMMLYATGDVQFLAPVFVSLSKRSFSKKSFCFLCKIFFLAFDSISINQINRNWRSPSFCPRQQKQQDGSGCLNSPITTIVS